MQDSPKSPKDRAVEAVGGVTRLAEAVDVTRSAVSQWAKIPVAHVLKIEQLTGIPRHELRPDVYPAPAESGAAA